MTKFSFEVPIPHLHDFDEDQDFFFTLSMLYQRPEYADYIAEKMSEGLRTIWVDNSFNEKFVAEKASDLVKIARDYRAAKLIVPDDINWSGDQIFHEYEKVFNLLRYESEEFMPIVVVKDPQMLDFLLERHIDHMAISYWNRHLWSRSQLREAIDYLDGNLHFLGLLSVQEVIDCHPKSLDTSMPIKLALRGQSLRQWAIEGYPHIHTKDLGVEGNDFFNTVMSPKQIALAKDNIQQLKEAATL